MNDKAAAADGGFTDARAHWDRRFSRPDLLFGEQPNRFLQREAPRLAPASRVLSVADGEGRNALYLASLGHRVCGFDISAVAVGKARELARQRGLHAELEVASVDDWDWDARSWDAVVAVFVQFANPPMRLRMFEGMWRALAPGGLLLVQGYTPRQLDFRTGGPGKVEHLYTADMLRGLLPQARWLVLREYEDELAEGSAHVGRSGLLDAVARKPE